MRKVIDFETTKEHFNSGTHKWYADEYFNDYLKNQQAKNLPPLKGFMCFIVRNEEIEDYVLIDSEQSILAAYPYTNEGFGQMEARINIQKIDKHFSDHEKGNV